MVFIILGTHDGMSPELQWRLKNLATELTTAIATLARVN
jgi:hypothetical protein